MTYEILGSFEADEEEVQELRYALRARGDHGWCRGSRTDGPGFSGYWYWSCEEWVGLYSLVRKASCMFRRHCQGRVWAMDYDIGAALGPHSHDARVLCYGQDSRIVIEGEVVEVPKFTLIHIPYSVEHSTLPEQEERLVVMFQWFTL